MVELLNMRARRARMRRKKEREAEPAA